MRVSRFDWVDDLEGREAASGTAVVGDPEQLERFLRRFVAANVSDGVRAITVPPEGGTDEGVRAILVPPGTQTVESVLYFPNYYLEGE
jgi:alkanesulfonate monooxygenase SsuD/methylene tetrahydromethanopterin reductase-like flavin-dependent oxidoreductase (luciferase family)